MQYGAYTSDDVFDILVDVKKSSFMTTKYLLSASVKSFYFGLYFLVTTDPTKSELVYVQRATRLCKVLSH